MLGIRAWPEIHSGNRGCGVLLYFEEVPDGKAVKQKICKFFGNDHLEISLQTLERQRISNSGKVNQDVIYTIEHGTDVTFRLGREVFVQPFPSDWTTRNARIFLSRYILGCHLDDLYFRGSGPDIWDVNDDRPITDLAGTQVETMVNREATKVSLFLLPYERTIYFTAYAKPGEKMADVQRVLAQTLNIMACQIYLMVHNISEGYAPLDPQWEAAATVQSYGSIYFWVYSSVVHFEKPSRWLRNKTASIHLEEDRHDNREFFQQKLQHEWGLTKELRFACRHQVFPGENLLLAGSQENLPILCTELEKFTFIVNEKQSCFSFSPGDTVQFVMEEIQKRVGGAKIAAIKRGKNVLKRNEPIGSPGNVNLEIVFVDNRTVIVNRTKIGYMNDTTTVREVKELYSKWLKRPLQSQQVFSRSQLLSDTDMASGHGELFIVDPSQRRKCSVVMMPQILLNQDVEIGKTIGFLRKLAEDKASEELMITFVKEGPPIPDDQFIFTFLCKGDAIENNFTFHAEPMAIPFAVEINHRWVVRFWENRNKTIQDLAGLIEGTIGCRLTSLTDADNRQVDLTPLRDAKKPLKASIQTSVPVLSIRVREKGNAMEKIVQVDINATLADLSAKLGHAQETFVFYTRDGEIDNKNVHIVDVIAFSNKPIEFLRRKSTSGRKKPMIITEKVPEQVVQKPKERPKIQISLIRGDEVVLEQCFEADQTIEDVRKRAQPLCNDYKKCRYQVACLSNASILGRDVQISTLAENTDLLLADMVDVYFMIGDKYEKVLEVPSSQTVGSILEKDIVCLKVEDDTSIVSQSGTPVDPSKEIGEFSCTMAVLLKATELLCTITVVFLEKEAKEYQVDGEAPVFSFVDFLMQQRPFEVIVEDEAGPVSLGSRLKDIKGVLTCKKRETGHVHMSETKTYRFRFGEKLLAVILPKNSTAAVAKREIADLVCTVDDLIVFTFRNGIIPDTLPLDDLGMLDGETIGVIVMDCGSCFLSENSERAYKKIQPVPLPEVIRPENFDELVERLYERAQKSGIKRSKVECKRLLNKCEYRFDVACREITA